MKERTQSLNNISKLSHLLNIGTVTMSFVRKNNIKMKNEFLLFICTTKMSYITGLVLRGMFL